jgi:hypothetical protein
MLRVTHIVHRRNSGFQGKGAISETSAQRLKLKPASPHEPPLSSTCCSPLGAGVPAEVRWSWPRDVFGKGFVCLSFISLLLVLLHSSFHFFLCPPTTSPINFYWFIIFLITSRLLVDLL